MTERLFTTHQVADLLGMTPAEVGKWAREEWLATVRLPDGSVRVSERGLVQFLKNRGVDIGQLMSSMAHQQRQTPPISPRPSASAGAANAPPTPPPTTTPPMASSVIELVARVRDIPAARAPAAPVAAAPTPRATATADIPAIDAPAAMADLAVDDGEKSALLDAPFAVGPALAVEEANDGADAETASPADSAGSPENRLSEQEVFDVVSRETPKVKAPPRPATQPAPAVPAGPSLDVPVPVPAFAAVLGRADLDAPEPARAETPPSAAQAGPAAGCLQPASHGSFGTAAPAPAAPPSPAATAPVPSGGQCPHVAAQILHAVLSDALCRSASHVHLESRPDGLALRLRVDGLLQEKPNFRARLPEGMPPRLIDHIFALAGLASADRNQPQSGSFLYALDGRTVPMELASFPTACGPRLVIRPAAQPARTFGELGLEEAHVTRLERLIATGGGLVLVAAPAGCGGTDWLTALAGLIDGTRSIVTLESLGRTDVAGANRVRLDPFSGQTMSRAAQGLWRQDADVVVVEELRDPSTATTAMLLALAGMMVLAGIRAPDPAAAIAMLLEMDLEAWSLSLALKAIVACRRVRRLCQQCSKPRRAPAAPTAEELGRLDLTAGDVAGARLAVGCPACGHTGYAGTVGLACVCTLETTIQRAIRTGKGESVAAVVAAAGGNALRAAALQRLREGVIGMEEFARAGV